MLSVMAFLELDVLVLWGSRLGSLIYFGFFLAMPWYSRQEAHKT
jgi:hypothetical protein